MDLRDLVSEAWSTLGDMVLDVLLSLRRPLVWLPGEEARERGILGDGQCVLNAHFIFEHCFFHNIFIKTHVYTVV